MNTMFIYIWRKFSKDERGNLASRRGAILRNPVGFKMDLNHIRKTFKRIDTWISEGADKFLLKQAHASDRKL